MGKFFVRLGSLAFIEVIGLRLLHLQNYMQYRAIIYLFMMIAVIIYIVAETCIESTRMDCKTDIEISNIENGASVEDFFECLEDLIEEIEKEDKKNE